MSYYPPEYNKIKISRNSINKEKIHLYKGVVTLEEFKTMVEKNIFPLVIVLGKNDLDIVNQIINDKEDNFVKNYFYIIADRYYQSKLQDDSSNAYMYLNINLLVNYFFDNSIYIDKFITVGEEDKFVYAMYDSVWIIPTKIGLINERKIFINKKKVEIIELSTLPEKVCVDYMQSSRKKVVLTQSEINDIHSKGRLTPLELVNEWEGLGLCVPGDAIGSAANRCDEFKFDCHNCLVDYANSIWKYDECDIKEKGPVLVKKK